MTSQSNMTAHNMNIHHIGMDVLAGTFFIEKQEC